MSEWLASHNFDSLSDLANDELSDGDDDDDEELQELMRNDEELNALEELQLRGRPWHPHANAQTGDAVEPSLARTDLSSKQCLRDILTWKATWLEEQQKEHEKCPWLLFDWNERVSESLQARFGVTDHQVGLAVLSFNPAKDPSFKDSLNRLRTVSEQIIKATATAHEAQRELKAAAAKKKKKKKKKKAEGADANKERELKELKEREDKEAEEAVRKMSEAAAKKERELKELKELKQMSEAAERRLAEEVIIRSNGF